MLYIDISWLTSYFFCSLWHFIINHKANLYLYFPVKVSEVKWKLLSHVWIFVTPMDYTVHGILQARILKWVVFPFSRGSSQPKDWTQVSCIADRYFTNWATREVHRENDIQIYKDLQDSIWSFYSEFSPNSILLHLPYNSLISSFLRIHQDIIFVFSPPQILFPLSNCSVAHSLPLWFILYIWVTE